MQNRDHYDFEMDPVTGEIKYFHNGKQVKTNKSTTSSTKKEVEKSKEERKKDTATYPKKTYFNIDMEMNEDGSMCYYDKDGFPLNNKTKKKKKDN